MSIANRIGLRVAAAAVATGAIAAGGLAVAGSAGASTVAASSQSLVSYRFQTLDNAKDLTFNQLLGINNHGLIAGYFGSGAAGHPNQGYLLFPSYGQHNYRNENFPGSVQTQVTGLNDQGTTVGFWSNANNANLSNANFGFYSLDGRHFRTVDFPTGNNATPPVDQLLGVNDSNVAVGFYTDSQGSSHGYTYSIGHNRFTTVTVPGAPGLSLTAAGINNDGDVTGFYTNAAGVTNGFLRYHGQFRTLSVPGASATQALGVHDQDEVVGVYTVGTGSTATMHGFTWTPGHGFQTVDDPHGIGTTTVNGVNDHGQLVGFYTDAAGNTDGFLAGPLG
jgi:hypothetical protein